MIMTVKMSVTPAQGLALQAMFKYWRWLGGVGSSRYVGFYCDGDGNFHPKCDVTFDGELPELTPEMEKAAIVKEENGNRTYDFDPIAWMLRRVEP